MDGSISLAWAVEFNYTQLGARLEAYAGTKRAISIFRTCVKHSSNPPVSKLPPELVVLITDALKDAVYASKVPEWNKARRCMYGECQTRDHFTNSERAELVGMDVDSEGEEDSYLEEAGDDAHRDVIEAHLEKLTTEARAGATSRFAKRLKVSP